MEHRTLDLFTFDSLNDLGYNVDIADNNGILLYCSRNYGHIKEIDIDSERMVGKHLKEVFDYSRGTESLMLKTLRTGKPIKDALWSYKSSNGKEYYYFMDTAPVFVKGERIGVISISRPLQSLKKAIDNLNNCTDAQMQISSNNSKKNCASYTFKDILFQDQAMSEIIEAAKNISRHPSSILIYGETGTGKELFAQSIHNESKRSEGPFVAINCSAIPENLLESTLFGTNKGAYTGAIDKPGLFEEAKNGTLFLDELNSMPLEMQAKLLRVLETKKIRRVGANKETDVDVRIISAINIDPMSCINNGKIRADLFYRLAVTILEIPPIRERANDIIMLAKYFIEKYNLAYNKKVIRLSNDVKQMLLKYQWPGNIRELKHAIEHAMNIVPDEEENLQKQYLPYYFINQFENSYSQIRTKYKLEDYKIARAKEIEKCERNFNHNFISAALESCGGNITKTAKDLNITRQYLHRLINENNINTIKSEKKTNKSHI